MANVNKVILIGNLTRDVELRYTPRGTSVAELGLAVNRKWKDAQGELQEEATFVGLVAWSRQAEVLNEYVHKGDPLYVEGRLTQDRWVDREGKKRSKTKVVIEQFQFLGRKRGGDDSDGAPAAVGDDTAVHPDVKPHVHRDGGGTQGYAPSDDDIPF